VIATFAGRGARSSAGLADENVKGVEAIAWLIPWQAQW
jgi:hypothetical protein